MPSSRGSSWPMDQTQVSPIAGGFFTVWATRKAQSNIHLCNLNTGKYMISYVIWVTKTRVEPKCLQLYWEPQGSLTSGTSPLRNSCLSDSPESRAANAHLCTFLTHRICFRNTAWINEWKYSLMWDSDGKSSVYPWMYYWSEDKGISLDL